MTYKIEITDITGGGSVVVVGPTVVGTTPYTPAAPLSVGHTYQWQVAAIDASGAASPWSSPTIFHVSPAAPTPTNPPAGGETSTTPTLQWSTASDGVTYEIEITDITNGGSVVVLGPARVGTTSYTTAPLSLGHAYQWQVAAIDTSGAASPFSNPTTFHVSLSAPALT